MPAPGHAAGGHAYQGLPLAGSPAARLADDAARTLAAGLLPRCPHPDQPAFWYLPAGMLACAPCANRLAASTGRVACHSCGAPASAVAAWVSGDVPCVAGLCGRCRATGLVAVTPN
jgi:hypothetical protein